MSAITKRIAVNVGGGFVPGLNAVITGVVPNPFRMPPGCKFQPRCPYQWKQCEEEPDLIEISPGRAARCWLHDPANAARLRAYDAEEAQAGVPA